MADSDLSRWRTFEDLPQAFGEVRVAGLLRREPADFEVEEIPAFTPEGEGEHALLLVRKAGANTDWLARGLAAYAGLPAAAVGYAGLKDRNALTTQWFSVHLARRPEPDWSRLAMPGVEVLEVHRHRRKLRRGALRGNRFRIRVRSVAGERGSLAERLASVRARGVPNYFGPQRFGHDDGNLSAAADLFAGRARRAGRHLRGLWLSAARSQLFNEVLALRVERGDWDRPLAGDRLQLAGSHSHFLADAIDETLLGRVEAFDLDPTGPLWGEGDPVIGGEPAELELTVARCFPDWTEGLAAAGLRQERRPLRIRAADLAAEWEGDDLLLAFALPPGAYATALLRELLRWGEVSPNDRPRSPPSAGG